MEWEKVLANTVQDGRIRELHLRKIPRLKTCDNWREVEPLGWIDYKMRFAHYKGGLVKLNGKIYFVTEQTLTALSEYLSIKFKSTLIVTKD